ncbi:hypothetical protein [Ruminococcus sp. HUN007]|uniref:hypothetical protein n=1 Tax=Ruminococcus sp. HUN007 TaxID=1514668 RepID=UPI000B0F705A|nr:hypothetical protein [Ruminococcus sp. HUN007]
MFWDKISPVYDLFENVYNHKVYEGTGKKVAEFIDSRDDVLECACGTGGDNGLHCSQMQKNGRY